MKLLFINFWLWNKSFKKAKWNHGLLKKHPRHSLYFFNKMSIRSEEVFEAYQLIRVLQPELVAKELKIVRLEESQF